jgi:Transcription factor zinc-finger
MEPDQNCSRCGKNYPSDLMTSSPVGNRFCQACWSKLNPQTETVRKCPVDGTDMKKRLVAEVVAIDVCTQCRGLWFDQGELEVIEKKSREMGWQDGFFLSVFMM